MNSRAFVQSIIIATAVIALAGTTLRSQDAHLPPAPFHAGVDLVTVTATVANGDGSFRDGLTANDFHIFENGLPQTIAFFGVDDVPVDLVLLTDCSASMTERLPAVRHAARILIDALRPRDRATIVTFGGFTRTLSSLTDNHEMLRAALDRMSAGGATPLYDAIYVALRMFGTDTDEVRRRALVVLSDGEDTASLLSYDTVLHLAQETGIAIYSVMLGVPGVHPTAHERATYEMRALATDTGGRMLLAVDALNLDPAYQSIGRELAHQYSIGYVSTHPPARNQFAWVSLKVSLTNVTVRTRRGYFVGK